MIVQPLISRYRKWRWNHRWRQPGFEATWLKTGPREFVATGFEDGWLAAGLRALDIGCGLGYTAAWLAQCGLDVVGIDFSPVAIRRAQRLHAVQPRLRFQVMDVGRAAAPMTSFDVLNDTGCFQSIPECQRAQYKRNALSWSRPGSRLVLPMHSGTAHLMRSSRRSGHCSTRPLWWNGARPPRQPERAGQSRSSTWFGGRLKRSGPIGSGAGVGLVRSRRAC